MKRAGAGRRLFGHLLHAPSPHLHAEHARTDRERPTNPGSHHAPRHPAGGRGPRTLLRGLILAAGWWVLSEGDPAALAFGVPVVSLALLASALLPSPPGPRWSPGGLVRFARKFLAGSVRGGVDVARRALAPDLPLAPALVGYVPRLPAGPALELFTGAVTLMPGTLVADREGGRLTLHVLVDTGEERVRSLRELEESIAAALGERLESSGG